MKIGNVAWGWTSTPEDMPQGDSLLQITKSIADLGFDLIDYLVTYESLDEWFTKENSKRLGDYAREKGLTPGVLVFQNASWTALEENERSAHMEYFKRCVETAERIGCTMISCILPMPTGATPWYFNPQAPAIKQGFRMPSDYSYRKDWDLLIQGLSKASDFAAEAGIKTVVECFPHSLVSTPHAMLKMIEDVNRPNFGIQFDTNHMIYQRIDPEYAVCIVGAENILNVHLKDSDAMTRNNLPPGTGILDYTSFLNTLKNIGYKGNCSIEVEFTDNPRRYVRQALEHVRLCMAGEY